MRVQSKSKQRGITFFGLVFVGVVLAVTGVIAAQVFPTFVEFQAIKKAAKKAAAEGTTVVEVRNVFQRAQDIDDFKSVSAKDLEVTKEGDKIVVGFSYEREIHLTGPAWLTLKYSGNSK
jgi:Tfp pilus assembly protein PilE